MACMETLKLDAARNSWLTISVLYMNNCCKKTIVLGRNWSQTAKLRQNCTERFKAVLVNSTVFVQYSVRYAVLRYGTVSKVNLAYLHKPVVITRQNAF